MSLQIRIDEPKPLSKRITLDGSLDTNTAPQLDEQLLVELNERTETVIFDLGGLSYISSAGLRSVFKVRKLMKKQGGKTFLINPQPQIKKVFDIVKAAPLGSIFSSYEELDAYLDSMQKKALDAE